MRKLPVPNGSQIQSVVFPKAQWTAREARSWLLAHAADGFKAPPVEQVGEHLRYRQEDPKKFTSYGYLTRFSKGRRILFLIGGHRKPKVASKGKAKR